MKRNILNFVIDGVSAVVMLAMVATGLLIRFALPPGSGNRRSLWGWGRHDWGDFHFWLAVGVAAVLVVHVAMHWQWVCATALRMIPRTQGARSMPGLLSRNLAGSTAILLFVGLCVGLVSVARRNVIDTGVQGSMVEAAHGRMGVGQASSNQPEANGGASGIRGSTSLAEVAKLLECDISIVRQRLNLPADVSADERLGQLSKRFGFSMSEAREKLLRDRPFAGKP